MLWSSLEWFWCLWVKIKSIKSMNFTQFCNQKGTFSTSNLQFAYFARSKMSIKGIVMFPGMIITRLKKKVLIILDFENGFLPTYLPLWGKCFVYDYDVSVDNFLLNLSYNKKHMTECVNNSCWFLSFSLHRIMWSYYCS